MAYARKFLSTVPKHETIISKIDELRAIAKEVAILSKSRFEEPSVHMMWMRDGRISLTLYAPSLVLNDGKKNHEFLAPSIDALSTRLDDVISNAKSELYQKSKNF